MIDRTESAVETVRRLMSGKPSTNGTHHAPAAGLEDSGTGDPAYDPQEVRDMIEAGRQHTSERGDAAEPGQTPPAKVVKPRWPAPVPVSQLPERGPAVDWILNGMIALGHLTLISALFKAGKTTFISHLLRCLQFGVAFIGRETRECRTLYVSEESQGVWRIRRDALCLDDHLHLMCRPMWSKPTFAEWNEFLGYIAMIAVGQFDLVVIDTIGAFAPWRNENDAAEVTATLNPLFQLTECGLAVVLFHHFGKSDGSEGRAARGSTAIGGAVDIMLELRRFKPDDLDDRRRVLSGLGRFDEIPSEIVVTLADDGTGFSAEGDKKAVAAAEVRTAILDVLPTQPPGWTMNEVHEAMPDGNRPKLGEVGKALASGSDGGFWQRSGAGRKGDPRRYWRGEN